MKSLILRTATRLLFSLLLLFSVFMFLRGHNEPGGGFIGGLVGASAFILLALSESVDRARTILYFDTYTLAGIGLLMATIAGALPLIVRKPFLTGLWWFPEIGGTEYHIGTFFPFDLGVYLVVIGFSLELIFGLIEQKEEMGEWSM